VTNEQTVEEMKELVATLRAEIARLTEELRRVRRDNYEVPPHYL
jgi:uncharacterized small protein (DUF1192 family)